MKVIEEETSKMGQKGKNEKRVEKERRSMEQSASEKKETGGRTVGEQYRSIETGM